MVPSLGCHFSEVQCRPPGDSGSSGMWEAGEREVGAPTWLGRGDTLGSQEMCAFQVI